MPIDANPTVAPSSLDQDSITQLSKVSHRYKEERKTTAWLRKELQDAKATLEASREEAK